jgi:hypothetical protein
MKFSKFWNYFGLICLKRILVCKNGMDSIYLKRKRIELPNELKNLLIIVCKELIIKIIYCLFRMVPPKYKKEIRLI